MKTKIFILKRNRVLTQYVELIKIDESVYTYLVKKHNSDKQQDCFAIVLKVKDVYFSYYNMLREYLERLDFLENAKLKAQYYLPKIRENIEINNWISLMQIKVWEALGNDPAPLIRLRNKKIRELRKKRGCYGD